MFFGIPFKLKQELHLNWIFGVVRRYLAFSSFKFLFGQGPVKVKEFFRAAADIYHPNSSFNYHYFVPNSNVE